MGCADALRRALHGARAGQAGPHDREGAGAGAELVERGARPEIGAKFRAFASDLDRAVGELDAALAGGDRAAVSAAGRRAMQAVERMEEFLDLAGGALVDLLSLDRGRTAAFGAVAGYGEGVAAAKEAAAAALDGDTETARKRLALAAPHLERPSGTARPSMSGDQRPGSGRG